MRSLSPSNSRAKILFILTIICLFASVVPLHTFTVKTDAAVILNNSDVASYDQWLGRSIKDLKKIGDRNLTHPDSFPRAIQAFTAIVGRYEGGGVYDADINDVISAMNNLGYIYTFHLLDYQKGIIYLNQALELAESKGIKTHVPVICLNLGAIYAFNQAYFSGIKSPDKSSQIYFKGLEAAREVNDWKNYLKLFNNVIDALIVHPMSFDKKILAEFRRCAPHARHDIMYPFTLLHMQAYEAMTRGDFRKADSLCSVMENKTTGFQDSVRYKLMALSEKARIKELEKDTASALSETIRIIGIARKNGCDDILMSFYDDARRLYASLGDKEKSEHYYILYLKQKDSVFDAFRMKAVSEYQFYHDINKMEHTVRDLSYHQKIQNVWLWALGIFSALAVLFALYYNYTNRRLRQRNQSLYRKNLINIDAEDRNFGLRKENERLRSELTSAYEKNRKTEANKYSYSILDEERKKEIHQKMENVIEEDRDIFNQNFSLSMLADKVGCPQTYLSQVISEKTDKNFYTILSERRIKEACRMLSDPANSHLTIEGVASLIGIRSRSNFTALFKKFTGLTPGEFARQSRETSNTGGTK